jgi:hypothetical protein
MKQNFSTTAVPERGILVSRPWQLDLAGFAL